MYDGRHGFGPGNAAHIGLGYLFGPNLFGAFLAYQIVKHGATGGSGVKCTIEYLAGWALNGILGAPGYAKLTDV